MIDRGQTISHAGAYHARQPCLTHPKHAGAYHARQSCPNRKRITFGWTLYFMLRASQKPFCPHRVEYKKNASEAEYQYPFPMCSLQPIHRISEKQQIPGSVKYYWKPTPEMQPLECCYGDPRPCSTCPC